MTKRITIVDDGISQLEFNIHAVNPKKHTGRVYFHFSEMEEYSCGMWRSESGGKREQYVALASNLMKHPDKFKDSLRRAIIEWPNSSLANLSDRNQNRIAWLGHAGCCVGVGSPEDVAREAWWTLSGKEQDDANRVGDRGRVRFWI